MSNLVSFNGSLEMRDEAGRTVRYAVVSGEQLQALQAECEGLRQQVAAQQQQISALTCANEQLQQERQGIWGLYVGQLREGYEQHPEEADRLEAEWADALGEAQKNPVVQTKERSGASRSSNLSGSIRLRRQYNILRT